MFSLLAIAAISFAVYQIFFRKPEQKVIFASRVVPFAGLPGIESMSAFSPDSKQMVFGWTAAADGSNQLQLVVGSSPRISPDGKFVLFNASVANRDAIHIVSTEGGASHLLIVDSATNNLPSWSADGRWIYFRSDRGGEFNLWRIASDGTGAAVQITKNGVFESFVAPDGTIFYTKDRDTVGFGVFLSMLRQKRRTKCRSPN